MKADTYADQSQDLLMLLDSMVTVEQNNGLLHADDFRQAVKVVGDRLVVDVDRLDIFSRSTKVIPDWKPKMNMRSYKSLTKMIVDIETTGGIKAPRQQALETELLMIGVRNERGEDLILSIGDMTEKEMLEKFLYVLNRKKPDLLITFNGAWFDLPYLVGKFEQHGLKHPFWINTERQSCFTTAQRFGKPTFFHGVHCKINGKKIHHIDLYHQSLAFDFVARKLTNYSLKEIPLQLDLRQNPRLDLGYQGILDCHARKDYTTLAEYLKFDLEDSELVADFLIPSIYYQQLFCSEFPLQSLATMGNGTKWNSSLKHEYKGVEPTADTHMRITGGKVSANAGFYPCVSKFDVASLYPTIMFFYGLCSYKDKKNMTLAIIRYGRNVRLGFKTLKNFIYKEHAGTPGEYLSTYKDAIALCFKFCIHIGYTHEQINKLIQECLSVQLGNDPENFRANMKALGKGFFKNDGAIKTYLNSGYGFLNTTGIAYNDPVAAALVTAVGRKILHFMKNFAIVKGARIVNMDTDAISIYVSSNPSYESNDKVFKELQKALPEWIEIEHELFTDYAYIPPVEVMEDLERRYTCDTKLAKKLFYKTFENEYLPDIDAAFIVWFKANLGKKVTFDSFYKIARQFEFNFPNDEGLRKNYIFFLPGGKIKSFGRYKKRDRNVLDKQWQSEYLTLYKDSPEAANSFYKQTRQAIATGEYPLEKLSIQRTIRKGEVKLVNLGIGKEGDSVTLYEGVNGINQGVYNGMHYVRKLDDLCGEIQTALLIMNDKEN
jgi:DNA polymerase elongation subunit (family B)